MSYLDQISPIDGRYGEKTRKLSIFFSEAGLIKYRIKIEIYYFLELCKIIPSLKKITKSDLKKVESIYLKLNSYDIKKVKKIEKKNLITLFYWKKIINLQLVKKQEKYTVMAKENFDRSKPHLNIGTSVTLITEKLPLLQQLQRF